jgi:hypothetical protein
MEVIFFNLSLEECLVMKILNLSRSNTAPLSARRLPPPSMLDLAS